MWVRGAPLIGVTAAYGVAIAMRATILGRGLERAWQRLACDAADRHQSALGAR